MIAQEDLVANILTKTVLSLTQWSMTSKLKHRIARLSVFLNTYLVSLLKTVLLLEAITHILSSRLKPVTYEAWKAQALTYKEIELEKKAIHHSFSAFSSKPHNPQCYKPRHVGGTSILFSIWLILFILPFISTWTPTLIYPCFTNTCLLIHEVALCYYDSTWLVHNNHVTVILLRSSRVFIQGL